MIKEVLPACLSVMLCDAYQALGENIDGLSCFSVGKIAKKTTV